MKPLFRNINFRRINFRLIDFGVLVKIFSYLDFEDIVVFGSCSKYFKILYKGYLTNVIPSIRCSIRDFIMKLNTFYGIIFSKNFMAVQIKVYSSLGKIYLLNKLFLAFGITPSSLSLAIECMVANKRDEALEWIQKLREYTSFGINYDVSILKYACKYSNLRLIEFYSFCFPKADIACVNLAIGSGCIKTAKHLFNLYFSSKNEYDQSFLEELFRYGSEDMIDFVTELLGYNGDNSDKWITEAFKYKNYNTITYFVSRGFKNFRHILNKFSKEGDKESVILILKLNKSKLVSINLGTSTTSSCIGDNDSILKILINYSKKNIMWKGPKKYISLHKTCLKYGSNKCKNVLESIMDTLGYNY